MGSIGIFVNNGSGRVCEIFNIEYYSQLKMDDKDCCPGGMLLQDADLSVLTLIGEFLFMCYIFLGVALGADKFMESIEVITSKEKTHSATGKDGEVKVFHTRVWNATVANLTLMALGSSAPEILLSVVEVFANEMASGPLGPSTIVGSAAFNLMIITALCIVALEDGETRTLKQLGVFLTTAFYSVWAYVWLLIIVIFWTPQVITVIEGILTMVFFAMLVINAYWADKYWDELPSWSREKPQSDKDAFELLKKVGLPKDASPEEMAKALADKMEPPKSKAYYRRQLHQEKLQGGKKAKVAPADYSTEMQQSGPGASSADADGFKARSPAASDAAPSDSEGGTIGFHKYVEKIPESGGKVTVYVTRTGGSKGEIKCSFTTKDQTAKAGKDYEKNAGEIVFADGDTSPKPIEVVIFDDDEFEKDEQFTVVLSDAQGEGAAFSKETDGGEEEDICTVMILNDDDKQAKISMAMKMLKLDSDSLDLASADYREAIKEAFEVPSDGKLMHFLTLPWKIMFKVLVPPAGLCNGWPCFVVALFWIGFQVVLISDFAGQMGCQMYLPETITAITIVALGTSLPDTFASMQAARQDKSADSSIGNVTGSNSVNVFLGLGLPWLIGSAYWAMSGANDAWLEKYGPFSYPPTEWKPGWLPPTGMDWEDFGKYKDKGAFFVSKTGLGFSVLVFAVLACATLAMILVRRKLDPPAELGGNKATAKFHASILIGFWLVYVLLSCITDPQWEVFSVDI